MAKPQQVEYRPHTGFAIESGWGPGGSYLTLRGMRAEGVSGKGSRSRTVKLSFDPAEALEFQSWVLTWDLDWSAQETAGLERLRERIDEVLEGRREDEERRATGG